VRSDTPVEDDFASHDLRFSSRAHSADSAFLGVNLVGQTPSFLRLLDTIERIAKYDVTVSIYGETGTGKELVARSLHYLGTRAGGPFVPVNCGTLPETLLENELFGHEPGAFTDACGSQAGLIAQADGGTLFLDEVEALSSKSQVALLRFLQDGEYRPLGGTTSKIADVRIVAASNVAFDVLRQDGNLRDDLFFRLNVVPVCVPPLRERPEDIVRIANHYLEIFKIEYEKPESYLHESTLAWMRGHDWPGNVRELENALRRAILLAESDAVYPPDVQPQATAHAPAGTTTQLINEPFTQAKAKVVQAFEKEYLTRLLTHARGNVTRAARHADKERRALGKLLKKHGLQPSDYLRA